MAYPSSASSGLRHSSGISASGAGGCCSIRFLIFIPGAVLSVEGRPPGFISRFRNKKKSCPLKAPQNEKGLSAAHKRSRLSLLPSGPDEVHGLLLRRTPVTLTKPSKDNCIIYYIYPTADRQSLSHPPPIFFCGSTPSSSSETRLRR